MEKQDFIERIAKYVAQYAPLYEIKVHSPIIAQAVLESGWGKSKLSAQYHNYFGLKCGTKWTGKSVNMSTQEEYKAGTMTTIKDNFRVYDSMEDGIKGYFEFIQLARYKNLCGITDPKTYLETIKADGYATSSAYVRNNMELIEQYNLTKYDAKGDDVVAKTEKQIIQQIINDAVEFAVNIANDNTHGYSQKIRSLYNIDNPKSFDCSSLVCTAFYYAFLKNGLTQQARYLKENCSYTGNMLKMLNCGFEVVATNQTAHAKMKKGDIELNKTYHTALAIDGNNIVHARSSEGTSDTKDNSGNEIRTQAWYLYSHGWTHRLRFTGKGINFSGLVNTSGNKPTTSGTSGTLSKTPKWVGKVTATELNVRTWAGTENAKLKSYPILKKGNLVDVCDSVKDSKGAEWYYIRIAGKYFGFASAKYLKKM